MRPRSVAAGTIILFAAIIAATVYFQQFLNLMAEKLALWTIISEIVGLGGLISAEAYVFLWRSQARAYR